MAVCSSCPWLRKGFFYPEVYWQEGRGYGLTDGRNGWGRWIDSVNNSRTFVPLFVQSSSHCTVLVSTFDSRVCLGGLADQCSLFPIALKTNQNSPFRYRERKSISFREGDCCHFHLHFHFIPFIHSISFHFAYYITLLFSRESELLLIWYISTCTCFSHSLYLFLSVLCVCLCLCLCVCQ